MAPTSSLTLRLDNEADTTALGVRIAPTLRVGDVILLKGQIGAGKTHLARAIIQARLASDNRYEDVPSPTFTLVQTYFDGIVEIWHADLYRLGDPAEIVELGLEDAFESAISLIEWPDRLGKDSPEGAISMTLAPDGSGRRLDLTASPSVLERLTPALEDTG